MPPKRNYQKLFIDALEADNEPQIRYLLEEGLVIYNRPLDISVPGCFDTFLPSYPLSVAAFYGSLAGVNLLLDYGALINFEERKNDEDEEDYQQSEVYTPLMWAARRRNVKPEVIITLLDRGAKYASQEIMDFTEDVLRYHLKDTIILKYLIKKGFIGVCNIIAIILEQFYRRPLPYFEAIFSITGDPNVLDEISGDNLLVEFMDPPRSSDDYLSYRIETIKGLIALGVDPNHKNKEGKVPADYASHLKLAEACIT
jgi:hypothetical protein